MKEYLENLDMNKKSIQQTKNHFKHKRVIKKPFPNRWENATKKSHCCDGVAVNNFVEDNKGVCVECGRKTTFRFVL